MNPCPLAVLEVYERDGHEIQREVVAGNRTGSSSVAVWKESSSQCAADHLWWQSVLRGAQVHGEISGSIRCIDLFSGVGGLTLGARMAAEALELKSIPALAIDTDMDALRIYGSNFATTATVNANMASMIDYHVYGRGSTARLAYSPEILEPLLDVHAGSTDLLLAGPPCQGHSSLNNHTRRQDPRNQLYVAAAVSAIALSAQMVVIENVPEVARDKTGVVETAQTLLKDAGYYVSDGLLKASDLGGAQTRRRHFTIATMKHHVPIREVGMSMTKPPLTLQEVIGDLEGIGSSSFMDEIPRLSDENRQRIDFLFDKHLHELPNPVRPDSHKGGHSYPSVYGRLHWDRPAPTITTGFMTPGRGRYVHPSERRVITPREAARIQGFPDTFRFCSGSSIPSRKLLAKWIGDAVPTQLGYVAVLAALSGY